MPFTPLDAEKERFRIGFRGYAREEVERFRAQVIASLEEHIALESQLKSRVSELESQVKRYKETEDLVKDSVVLAQRTCDELIAAAHQKADAIKLEAHQEGSRIRAELAQLRSQREQFEYAFHGLLAGFTHRLEQGNPALASPSQPHPAELSAPAPATAFTQTESDGAEIATSQPAPQPVPADNEPELPSTPVPDTDDSVESTINIPDVPKIPEIRIPRVPAPASGPERAAPRPASVSAPTEVDRDADIDDFTAALDSAPAKDESGWMDKDRQSGLFGLLEKLAPAGEMEDPDRLDPPVTSS